MTSRVCSGRSVLDEEIFKGKKREVRSDGLYPEVDRSWASVLTETYELAHCSGIATLFKDFLSVDILTPRGEPFGHRASNDPNLQTSR